MARRMLASLKSCGCISRSFSSGNGFHENLIPGGVCEEGKVSDQELFGKRISVISFQKKKKILLDCYERKIIIVERLSCGLLMFTKTEIERDINMLFLVILIE